MTEKRPRSPSTPTTRTVRKVLALAANRCAFPGCTSPMVDETGTTDGDICHIRARNPRGKRFDAPQTEEERHAAENLIALCRNHHATVDGDATLYSVEALQAMKATREKETRRTMSRSDEASGLRSRPAPAIAVSYNAGPVVMYSPGAVVAGSVTLRGARSARTIQPPPGTIGADPEASRYVDHLITRYNEYASRDRSRTTEFRFGAISKNIENLFRSRWRLLPMETFDRVCVYLQGRIARTRIAKLNASKGKRAFSTFEEYRRR